LPVCAEALATNGDATAETSGLNDVSATTLPNPALAELPPLLLYVVIAEEELEKVVIPPATLGASETTSKWLKSEIIIDFFSPSSFGVFIDLMKENITKLSGEILPFWQIFWRKVLLANSFSSSLVNGLSRVTGRRAS